jgi:hypothetical protein
MWGNRIASPSYYTMRDVDKIIESFRELYPAVEVSQLKVLHPGADDDGLWFFSHCESLVQAQIESPNGMCPFLVEADESEARTTNSIDETVQVLTALLRLAKT